MMSGDQHSSISSRVLPSSSEGWSRAIDIACIVWVVSGTPLTNNPREGISYPGTFLFKPITSGVNIILCTGQFHLKYFHIYIYIHIYAHIYATYRMEYFQSWKFVSISFLSHRTQLEGWSGRIITTFVWEIHCGLPWR